jgi:glycosyltransferase involved in cell wall biosynthesis
MKVVYDITNLGGGFYKARSRAGIFRVIESLVVHLENLDECELYFWANRIFVHTESSFQYLKNSKNFNKNKFILPNNFIYRNCLKTFFYIYPKRKNSKIYNLLKKIFSRTYRFFPSDLSEFDIFHSTFHPIPEFKNYKHLKRFLSVMDLIPILFPQFYDQKEGHRQYLINILNSIKSDDRVFCISESTKNDLCDYLKIHPGRVKVTHLAASKLFYECRDSLRIKMIKTKYGIPKGRYVLSLNTLEPRKNIKSVISAFAQTVTEEKIGSLNLVLTGTKGWKYESIFDEISKYPSLKNRIIFTGYVDDDDLAPLYSDALVFVYPSYYEGFGLPPLEAMQCGCPVISSNKSSLPEVVGDAAIMVSPDDLDSISQGILDIYRNKNLYEMMKKKSLARAKLFSWEKCAKDTIETYRMSLNND